MSYNQSLIPDGHRILYGADLKAPPKVLRGHGRRDRELPFTGLLLEQIHLNM